MSAHRDGFTRRRFLSFTGGASIAPTVTRYAAAADVKSLQAAFLNPPADARPKTRWWWFGGAITPDEITRELTFMRDAGIGGVELQPVYPVAADDPKYGIRNTPYFSDAWFDLVRHTARETERLALQFDFTLGSGWSYGGPFVPVELAARRLRFFHQTIEGPAHGSFDFLLGQLVEGDEVECALAAPVLPSGTLDITQSKVLARGREAAHLAFSPAAWQVPAGKWVLMLFVNAPTRQQVKRPTIGMEGFVLDHFNAKSLAVFLTAVGDRTFRDLESAAVRPIHSVFCDSLEVYGADWTNALLHEFQQRRGYDLAPYLPALWQNVGPLTAHIRYDYHLTLSDLILDNFFRPLVQWSEARNVTARIQAHGAMGDVMRAYSFAHIPEGESNPGADRYAVNLKHRRLASSAGHIYGKPVISAETYTWLRAPLFLETLEMMKAASDAMFLDGINQIVNHGYSSSPPAAGLPGWTFYASSMINHNNTWWRHYPYLAGYIRRVSAILRMGRAVNPIAVYLPLADVYAKYGCGGLNIDEVLEKHVRLGLFHALRYTGYDFDVINDHALTELAAVASGWLRAGTAEYRAVIVPPCNLMPAESLERLAEFSRSGGILIFVGRTPEGAPGFKDQSARTAKIKEKLQELLGNAQALVVSDNAAAVERLQALLAPDFTMVSSGANTTDELKSARQSTGFAHRKVGQTDVYFISNISNVPRDLRLRCACGQKRPELWNPETGQIRTTLVFEHVADATEVQLCLAPFESCFLVFSSGQEKPLITRTNWPAPLEIKHIGDTIRVSGDVAANGEFFLEATGRTSRFTVSGVPNPMPIVGPWSLRLGNMASIELERLGSWTDLSQGKGYSGWARYETEFEMNPQADDIDWTLDLGVVHETAEVELNGVALGAAWKGSRKVSTKTALRPGKNQLQIEVANLWIHKVVNSPPWDRRRVAETYGARWGESDVPVPGQLPPSGLLGPVRLVPFKRWSVTI